VSRDLHSLAAPCDASEADISRRHARHVVERRQVQLVRAKRGQGDRDEVEVQGLVAGEMAGKATREDGEALETGE
jgi:hypothetical protein